MKKHWQIVTGNGTKGPLVTSELQGWARLERDGGGLVSVEEYRALGYRVVYIGPDWRAEGRSEVQR